MRLRIDRVRRRKRSRIRIPRGREVPSSRRIFLGKKSGSIPVDRGRGNVASVRFARRMAKGRRMKGGGWTNGWTSFTHRRRAYLANDERRGWRYKGGSSLFVAANSIQTASLNLYPRLCSQSFLRFSKPIFLLRERKEFLILSPISFDPIIARLFPNVFRVLNNSSSSPIVKLECNSAVNQN